MKTVLCVAGLAVGLTGTQPAAAVAQSPVSNATSSPASPHLDYAAIKARYAHARWTYPTGQQIGEAYPRGAEDSHIQGAAQVACFIQADGRMKRCVVLTESPQGEGFGIATRDLFLTYAQVDPGSVQGGIQPDDFYIFTLKWQLG